MHSQLQQALINYRQHRNFDPQSYLNAKSALLNLYFQQSGIKSCIIGVSGGLNSALTAAILVHASRLPGSPLEKIVPLLLPIYAQGATHQDTAIAHGSKVCQALGVVPIKVDLSSTFQAAHQASSADTTTKSNSWAPGQLLNYLSMPVSENVKRKSNSWASGQLLSHVRMSVLCHHAALLNEQGLPSVVCGTTNRDKGSYIGFFDKASDGMVDLLPISDLHNSEVYKLSALLGIPEIVLKSTPTPTDDTYDGTCDEEMIGTSYSFLELYEWWLCDENRDLWLKSLDAEAGKEFKNKRQKLEDLHQKNKYKYIADSSAIHLDLLERAVPGGWRRQGSSDSQISSLETSLKSRVGSVNLSDVLMRHMDSNNNKPAHASPIIDFGDSAILIQNAISSNICSDIVSDSMRWTWVETDNHGRQINENSNSSFTPMGSFEATTFDESFANLLWKQTSSVLPKFRTMSEFTSTNHQGYPVWKPIGINPMIRFIRYEKGGHIIPHYDSGFNFDDKQRCTLMSVIILLSESTNDGTRFLLDKQRNLPTYQRNFKDWKGVLQTNDVLFSPVLAKGDALIFDHKILTDIPSWNETNPHIILKTDIIFERCASHAISWNGFPLSSFDSNMDVTDGTLRGYHDQELDRYISFFPDVRTAPLTKLFRHIPSAHISTPLTVLVTTGGMCPLHKGHINMMNEAKKVIEKSGKVVLAGFIVPDDDTYVLGKIGKDALNIAQRIYLAEQAIIDNDWLMIDHWAGFYGPKWIDYMPIVHRLKAQLAAQVPIARSIQVIYVCGGDKAGFSYKFVNQGALVVVSRPGSTFMVERMKSRPEINNNPRITFVNEATNSGASSKIRKGDLTELPQHVVESYLKIHDTKRMRMSIQLQSSLEETTTTEEVDFYIRHEGFWAVSHWAETSDINFELYSTAYNIFCNKLVKLFEESFEEARKVSGGPKVHIIPINLSDQQKAFQKIVKINHKHDIVISLDPCLPSTHNIAISKCFELVGVNDEYDFVASPGSEPLEKQLDQVITAIKNKGIKQKVVLFDGGSFTNHTFTEVKSLIQSKDFNCTIDESIALFNSKDPLGLSAVEQRSCLGLINCRDFLVGSRKGGLVVRIPHASGNKLGENICRVPCFLPYLRPAYQANVPIDQELTFSQQVLQLNKEFMNKLGLPLNAIEDLLDHLYHT